MRNTDKWHPAESAKQPISVNWRALFLAIVAIVCIANAVVCAATSEAVNAANWFGFGFVALALLTLRACLIDIKRGTA